jgi:GDP-4-dehydro-6-deoxy-D-mannose reductase
LVQAPHCTLLFASSADTYGSSFRTGTPATEATVLAPMNIYSATKAAADLTLGAKGYG